MNMTIKKYILKQRIEESIELLKNDVYSITYLSNLFQFSNPSHFSSVFKSHVGLSPRDFKKKYININN
jgi:AraC-like DNA-binding protein